MTLPGTRTGGITSLSLGRGEPTSDCLLPTADCCIGFAPCLLLSSEGVQSPVLSPLRNAAIRGRAYPFAALETPSRTWVSWD